VPDLEIVPTNLGSAIAVSSDGKINPAGLQDCNQCNIRPNKPPRS
jgi:hypothetical protein